MQKVIAVLCGCCLVALTVTAVLTPQPKVHHADSTAYTAALSSAVDRLEHSNRTVLGATAILLNAAAPAALAQGAPTFEGYTCQAPTCDTYNPQRPTCERTNPICSGSGVHTTEPPPYDHTCQGQTCDGSFTCDFTADPRAPTCDAANTSCQQPTFNAFQSTCDPLQPACRPNNPGACTAQPNNPTCSGAACPTHTSDPRSVTCDASNPVCPPLTSNPGQVTCDPAFPTCDQSNPLCRVGASGTTWGKVKDSYRGR
jgi:hypothetical protein